MWNKKDTALLDFPSGTESTASAGFDSWSGKIPHAPEQLSHAPQLLNQRFRALEPQLVSPGAAPTEVQVPRAQAPQQEKPLQWEARGPQWRGVPARLNRRKLWQSNGDPVQPKINEWTDTQNKNAFHYVFSYKPSYKANHSLSFPQMIFRIIIKLPTPKRKLSTGKAK